MLEKLKGKKVEVGVAFGGVNKLTSTIATKYYEGIIEDFDANFIMLNDGTMISIKYIQSIKVL